MGLVPWEDERIDSWWLGQWRQTPGDDFALEWPAIDAEEPQRWILNGPLASDIVPKSSQRLSSQASYGYSGRFEVAPGEQLVFQVRSIGFFRNSRVQPTKVAPEFGLQGVLAGALIL